MGRNAPEQEYEIITCYSHFNNDDPTLSGYRPNNIPLYYEGATTGLSVTRLSLPSPYNSSGASITGLEPFFISGSSSGIPYVNNQFVLITDDKKAVNIGITGTTNGLSGYSNITNIYEPKIPSNILSTSSGAVGFPAQPVSVYQEFITGSYVGGVEKLNDDRYLILSYSSGTIFSNSTGNSNVWLTIGSVSNTGVVLETPSIVPGTDNSAITTGCVVPCLVKDLSYTGDVNRVLIGYRASTGVSSGLICATLAEISGTTITYGDEVAIRPDLIANTANYHNGSIRACYHPRQTGYVISTTVSGTGTVSARSGELIACNPPSGLTLSGYFGTPVVSMDSNTTGVTGQINHIACQALTKYTGVTDYGISIAVARGGNNSASGDLYFQTYEISGTTITTGTIALYTGQASGNFVTDKGSTSGTLNRCIFEEESPTTDSGLISYLGATTNPGASNGTQFMQFNAIFLLDYSLTTNLTVVSTNSHPSIDVTRRLARPAVVPAFKTISGNPYSGTVFSALNIALSSGVYRNISETVYSGNRPERRLVTIKDNIGYVDVGGDTLISGARTQCVLSSGDRSTNNLGELYSGWWNALNVVDYRGTFPNYSGLTCITATGTSYGFGGISLVNIVFSSGVNTPGMTYRLTSGIFTKPIVQFSFSSAGFVLNTYKNMSIGLVVNPDALGSGVDLNAVTVENKENVMLNTVKVKVPKTEKARLNLFNQGLKSFELIFPFNIFN